MPTVTGDLKYVTTRPEDIRRASIRAPRARSYGGAVITTSTDYVDIVNGKLSFTAAPGPVVVTLLRARGPVEVLELVVSEAGGSLADAVAAAEIAGSATRSQLETLAAQATDAVRAAQASASAASNSESSAAASAAAAKKSETTAGESASAAAGSSSAAANSASGAKASASAAAGSASAAKNSETAAGVSATAAKKSETAAAASAATASNVASSTSWNGDVLTVNGKTSPHLTGPPGPKGDTGSVENVVWDDISDKPAVFPPNTHTHTMVQVTGLDNALAGKTDKAYVDAQDAKQLTASEVEAKGASPAAGKVVRRDSAGQVLVPTAAGGNNTAVSRSELTSGMAGKADKSYVDAVKTEVKVFAESRPAFFSGSGGPPSTIPGAVVGDYYLNETTMELHKITGV
ncbi:MULTISPECIES: hypothetical protein [Corynebacterium]|uniref:hypothetical protein n=1 Tax=Corynebacterium TaxID=1716 RepID=UPI0011C712B8|nr:hypothetical protein [Corynebacterium sp. LK14]TXS64633.1 hypothetical protein CHU71_04410 [Corynebacterium sp. LK14]HAT1360255.1 hypothetical protein [Corynebacterium striatum]